MGTKHSFAEAFAQSTSRTSHAPYTSATKRSARGRSLGAASSSTPASTKIPLPLRGRKLLPYLPMTVIALLSLGLAFVLGGFMLSRTVPNTAVAGESGQDSSQETGQDTQDRTGQTNADRFLATPTGDVPLLEFLLERQALLDEREKKLNKRETDLRDLQKQLEEKLATLTMLRAEIGELVQEKETFEAKRFEHLVKVYEGMKPAEAAPLVERLNERTAVRLFYRMEEKKVSRILGFLNPEIAAKLSERLAILQQKEKYKTTQ